MRPGHQQTQPAPNNTPGVTTASSVNVMRQFNSIAMQVFHRTIETLVNRQEIILAADYAGLAVGWMAHLQNMYKTLMAECEANPDTYMIFAHLNTATHAIYGSYEEARTQTNHGMEGQANMYTNVLYARTTLFIKQSLMIKDPNSPAAQAIPHEEVLNNTILMYERMVFYNGVILCLADQVRHYPHIITHEDIDKGLDAFLKFTYSIGAISGNPIIDNTINEQMTSADGSRITEEELQIIRGERTLTASTLRFVRVLSCVDPSDFDTLIQMTQMIIPMIAGGAGGGIGGMISNVVASAMPNLVGDGARGAGGGGGGKGP